MASWLFSAFRDAGWPTQYPSFKTPVTVDVLIAGIIYAGSILLISGLIVAPGAFEKRGAVNVGWFLIGVIQVTLIFFANFGQEWESAAITTHTAYKVGFRGEIEADVGLHIGLRSINVTLKGRPVVQQLGQGNETINYNERFSWDNQGWTEGRLGFGPFAGKFNQDFRAAQYKGLPYPILWIAEYFTIDGEGIRWGRYYRNGGYYCHILLWLASVLAVFSMMVWKMVVQYAGFTLLLTGLVMGGASMVFHFVRNPTPLTIPFDSGHLELKYGWHFWLCTVMAIGYVVIGLIISFAEMRFHRISAFLKVDEWEEYYEVVVRGKPDEIKICKEDKTDSPVSDDSSSDDEDIYVNVEQVVREFRKRNPTGRRLQDRSSWLQDNPVFIPDDPGQDRPKSIHPPPGAKIKTLYPPASTSKHRSN